MSVNSINAEFYADTKRNSGRGFSRAVDEIMKKRGQ